MTFLKETKICCSCKINKKAEEFYSNKLNKDDLASQCKACQKRYSAQPENRERHRQAEKRYREKNRDKRRKWYQENKIRVLRNRFKRDYNITLEEYDQLFEEQNGVCAICALPEIIKRLSVDHNHKTGKIRGLLCQRCNQSIGGFEDNPILLEKAAKYLRRFDDFK